MTDRVKLCLTSMAFVALVVASVSQAWALPTISIVEDDTGPPMVTITGFPGNILFIPTILDESVTLQSSSISNSPDFGPAGFVLTEADGSISDVVTIVVVDSILLIQFDSDSPTNPLTAPPGLPVFAESATPQTLVVTPGAYPQFLLSVLSDSDATTVPEPATMVLVAAGAVVAAGVRYRQRRDGS